VPPVINGIVSFQDENQRGATVNHIAKSQELERVHGVTWGQLTGLEPRLNELLWKAREDGARCQSQEEASWVFGPIRNAVAELVGFRGRHRNHPVLGSVGAYEVAYWRIYAAVVSLLPKPSDRGPLDLPGEGGQGTTSRSSHQSPGVPPMQEAI
jgi:hypothetical protein